MIQKPLKEELENLYWKERLSYSAIGRIFFVTPYKIGEWLKSYGIPTRKGGEGRIAKEVTKPTKEELEKLYWDDFLPTTKIAKKIGVDERTIKTWILGYGIKYRAIERAKLPKLVEKPSKEDLIEFYSNRKLSTRQIAKLFKVTKGAVLHWLKVYSILVRDSRKIAWETRGITPPFKEQLQEDYKILSLALIAKKYGVSVEAILILFRKYDFKVRTLSESRKLAIREGRGEVWNKGLTMENPKIAETVRRLHQAHMEKIEIAKTKQAGTRRRLAADGRLKIWNKGKKLPPEHVEKLRAAKKRISSTPEFRARMREIGMRARPKYKNTEPERLMRQLLEKEGLIDGLEEQYHLIIGDFGTKPDFAYPAHKVAIYCDGEYWHGGISIDFSKMKDGPRKNAIEKIKKKDERTHYVLGHNNWVPLRFWQRDIEEHPADVVSLIRKNLFDQEYIREREMKREEWKKQAINRF